VRAARQVGADAVEIHTGSYCEAFRSGNSGAELDKIRTAATYASSLGMRVFAGHGLDVRTSCRSLPSARSRSQHRPQHRRPGGVPRPRRGGEGDRRPDPRRMIAGIGVDIVDVSRVAKLLERTETGSCAASSRTRKRSTPWGARTGRSALPAVRREGSVPESAGHREVPGDPVARCGDGARPDGETRRPPARAGRAVDAVPGRGPRPRLDHPRRRKAWRS